MKTIEQCILCGGREFRPHRAGRYGQYVQECVGCSLVLTNPQPELSDLVSRYGEGYYEHWMKPEQRARRERLWKRRLKRVRRWRSGGRLLDVGCGEGLFLNEAAKAGFEVWGLELSGYAADYARQNFGVNVQKATLEEATFPAGSFDVITFWHSLEHIPEPVAALRRAFDLLAPGGIVLVAVPNVDDVFGQAFYRLVKGRYFEIYSPETKEPHLWHFSPETLKQLLEKCGFGSVRVGADFAQVDPYWRVIEWVSRGMSFCLGRGFYLANLGVGRKPEATA